ncbi:hypothetical protein Tco_0245540 [Tanacetum coccineum]
MKHEDGSIPYFTEHALWELTGFGGNKESKKIQKTILKQNYENIAAKGGVRIQNLRYVKKLPSLSSKDQDSTASNADDFREVILLENSGHQGSGEIDIRMLQESECTSGYIYYKCLAVATKSRQVSVNAAKQCSPRAATSISTARPINTATPKPKVNDALPITYSYFKAHSLGNPQYTLQDQEIFNSGCSRHMTGNKSFLTNYQKIHGGFVIFGGSPKGVTTENQTNKNAEDAVAEDAGKKTNEKPANEAKLDNLLVQRKEGYATSTNRVSTVSPSVSAAGQSFDNADDLPTDPLMLDLEDTADLLNTSIFSGAYDDEDVGAEADLNNLETTMNRRNKSQSYQKALICLFSLLKRTQEGDQALDDPSWIEAMQDKLLQFRLQKVWRLVDYPKASKPLDQNRIEAIRLFFAYASFMGFIMFQMDVKSSFLYGTIRGADAQEIPDEVLMRDLTFFLGLQRFDFATVKTASILIATNKALLKDEEAEDVDVHLYRSLMYLTASKPDIMFVVCAYARFQVTPKVSHLHAVKRIFRYLKDHPKLGLWYPRDSLFDLEAFSNSDYARAILDRKSTTGGCQFLGKRLISWQCKKQTIVSNSTTEAEYVAAANCCGQVLRIQNQMLDYEFNFMNTKIHIDNESTICIVKNPVFHSKTKHIEIRHHFIRDSYEKRLIQVIKIHTNHNVADLLTKAFDVNSDEFKVKTGSCKVNAAKQDLVLLGEKGNADFHKIVDFLNVSTIRYSLTTSPTIYASYIEQFWATAKSKIVNNETQIHAKVDGKTIVISESSVRSNLHFNDEDGVTSLTNSEILENLALMGYEIVSDKLTFQKAFFSPQWKYLIHTILHCLSSKSTAWNEFSTNIASAVICLANNQKFNFSKLIFDEPFNDTYETPKHTQKVFANMRRKGKSFSGRVTPLFASMLAIQAVEGEVTIIASHPQKTQTPRRAKRGRDTEIPQSGGPLDKVGDEAVHKELGDIVERATTTTASLDAEQDSGNILNTQSTTIPNVPLSQEIGTGGSPRCQEAMGGTIAQTRSERVPTSSYDSPLLGGNTPGSDEERLGQHELTNNKVEGLESDLKKTKKLYATVFKKLINRGRYGQNLETQEGFCDSQEVSTAAQVSTASTFVSTASPQRNADTTADDLTLAETLMEIRKSAAKDKGKAKMDEIESPRKMKQRERVQISRDEEVAQKLQEEVGADEDFVQQLQAGEKCRKEDLPMKLVELVNQRKKFFAQQRAEAKRNKPMTPAQQKDYMSNYIKNQE